MRTLRATVIAGCLAFTALSAFAQETIRLKVVLPGSVSPAARQVLGRSGQSGGGEWHLSELKGRIDGLIGHFEDSGFPFVRISMDSVRENDGRLSGSLIVDPGRLVTVDTLMNRTGFRISPAVLSRLVNIRPGDRYRESAVREASQRLAGIQYLRMARLPEVGFHDSSASLYLYPEKNGANRFDGWIGLAPAASGTGAPGFAGAITLDLLNLAGQGEEWQLDWRRNQDRSQKLVLRATTPYLVGLPLGIDLGFDLLRQDTSYLNTGWETGIPYHFSPEHSLGIFYRHRASSLVHSPSGTEISSLQPFTTNLSGISWQYVHLDNPVNPYRGLSFRFEASTGRKIQSDTLSMKQSTLQLDATWFLPVVRNLTLVAGVHSGYLEAPQLLENEKFRIGGLSFLRGFDEEAFRADAFAAGSFEIRYLLDRNSHLVLLADFGMLRNREGDLPAVWSKPLGLGVGGQVKTNGGIFRIIFALGKEPGQSFQFRNSKIHIGYVGIF